RAGVEENTAALNPSSISHEDTVLPTSPDVTQPLKQEVKDDHNDVTQCRPVVQNVTGNRNIFAGPGATQNITVTGENKTCILI
ncbi:hypothetical protein ScPMuIL_011732, partial [Solemya velum]